LRVLQRFAASIDLDACEIMITATTAEG
jgi:hypothetical protein